MRQRDERGAVFPLTVVIMALIVAVLSLVIDVGHDRVVRRDMQAMADVIALDMVRILDGRPAGAYTAAELNTAKDASVSRQQGLVEPDVEIQLAVANRMTGDWHPAAPAEVPNAVQVKSNGTFAFRVSPRTSTETVQAAALAVIGPPIACISAGATFADVDPQGALDTLLGKTVGVDRLTVLDPYGLAALDLEIPLVDLAAKLGVGSVQDIVNAEVSAYDFVLAISDVLPTKNGSEASPKALLDAILNGLPDTNGFLVSEILKLDTGGGSATTVVINTFTLVQAVIMVANRDSGNFIDLTNVVSLPGMGKGATIRAKVIEPPQIACGPVGSTARSAQVQVELIGDITALGGLVASLNVNLRLTVADGSGTITDVQCTVGDPTVTVNAQTAVGTLQLDVVTELLLKLTKLVIEVPQKSVKPQGASVGTSTSESYTFTFPDDDLPLGRTFGEMDELGLSGITPLKIDVIGLPVGGLLNGVVIPVLGLIDGVATTLLEPILAELGVNLGTVRIQPTGRPSCNEPFLLE